MKAKVTQNGVYGKDGKEIPVGTVVNVKGDALPGYLVGKSEVIEAPRVAVINPAGAVPPVEEPGAGQ